MQRRAGEADIRCAQRQRFVAGIEIDRAGEIDVAIGADVRAPQHRQRGREIDVAGQLKQSAQPLDAARRAQVVAEVGCRIDLVAEHQPARAQPHLATDLGEILGRAIAEIDVQVAAVGGDVLGQLDGATTTDVRIAGNPHIAAVRRNVARDQDAVRAQQRDAARAGRAVADRTDIMVRQRGDRRIVADIAGIACDQVECTGAGRDVGRTRVRPIANRAISAAAPAAVHVDAAGARNFQRVVGVGKADRRASVVGCARQRVHRLGAEADVALHDDIAVAAIVVQVVERDVARRLQQHVGGLRLQRRGVDGHVAGAG